MVWQVLKERKEKKKRKKKQQLRKRNELSLIFICLNRKMAKTNDRKIGPTTVLTFGTIVVSCEQGRIF